MKDNEYMQEPSEYPEIKKFEFDSNNRIIKLTEKTLIGSAKQFVKKVEKVEDDIPF